MFNKKNIKYDNETAREVGMEVYYILISRKGYSAFSSAVAKQFPTLQKTILTELGKYKGKETKDILEKIKKVAKKLNDLSKKDYKNLISLIKNKYFVEDIITVQGIVFAIYDWIRQYLNEYYELITETRNRKMINDLRKEILDLIDDNLLNGKSLREIITQNYNFNQEGMDSKYLNGLVNPSDQEQEEIVLKNNRKIVWYFIQIDNPSLINSLLNLGKSEKDAKKAIKKFAKINERIREATAGAIKDRENSIDSYVQQIIFSIFTEIGEVRETFVYKDFIQKIKTDFAF